jgi:hypothetical protein
MPVSWQVYVLGMRHLALAAHREMLRIADAVGAGMATPEGRTKWESDIKPFAGI